MPARLVEYQTRDGASPFTKWFETLDAIAAAKVTVSLVRMEQGNFSNAKGVGGGVYEFRVSFGPGYRIYFGKDGGRLVVLLAGGTKKRQQRDIETAKERWRDYKQRKSES